MLSTKCVNKSYVYYIYKDDLALNNQKWLICHKTQPNQTKQEHLLFYICNIHGGGITKK